MKLLADVMKRWYYFKSKVELVIFNSYVILIQIGLGGTDTR